MLFIRLSSNINHSDYSFRLLIVIREHMAQFLRLNQRFEWTKSLFPYCVHGLNSFKYQFSHKIYYILFYLKIFVCQRLKWTVDNSLFKSWSVCSHYKSFKPWAASGTPLHYLYRCWNAISHQPVRRAKRGAPFGG